MPGTGQQTPHRNRRTAQDATAGTPAPPEQLAAWDPYDQNASADFFDPEWMFGLKCGFDVIIGNPPYINTKRGIKDKDTLKRLYRTAIGQFDVFTLFIEFGITHTEDALSFIVPKPFINNENYEAIRRLALSHSILKVVIGSNIFEAAGVESCIFVLSKRSAVSEIDILQFEDSTFHSMNRLKKHVCNILPFHMLNTELRERDIGIYEDLRSKSVPLGNILEITRGVECGKNDRDVTTKRNAYHLLRGDDVQQGTASHTRATSSNLTQVTRRNSSRFQCIGAGRFLCVVSLTN